MNVFVLKDMSSGEIDAILQSEKTASEVEDIIRNLVFSKGWTAEHILPHIKRVYGIETVADYTKCSSDDFEISY